MDDKEVLDDIYDKPEEAAIKNPSIFNLISEAENMLRARQPDEQKLIYSVAKLPQEEKNAIIEAYQNIHGKK
jgi:hypothetical protein